MEIEELAKVAVDRLAECDGRLKLRTIAKQVLAEQIGNAPTPVQVRKLATAVTRLIDDRAIPASINEHDSGGGRHIIRKHILE